MTVFVSGASGFIGSAIVRALAAAGEAPMAGLRHAAPLPPGAVPLITGDLADGVILPAGISVVIHAAGLGHRRGQEAATWHRANVTAAIRLAESAVRIGVRSFVLISTAHVHGRAHAAPVRDDAPLAPADFYADSKLEAERQLAGILGDRLTIIRPVAVIGPGCPGNIPRLIKVLRTRLPLPLGGIANRRSFIHVEDLARLVQRTMHAQQPPRPMLAAHPESISTPDLIGALGEGLALRPRLITVSPAWLGRAAQAAGGAALWAGLAGSFVAAPTRALDLGWQPSKTLRENLIETARYYNTTS